MVTRSLLALVCCTVALTSSSPSNNAYAGVPLKQRDWPGRQRNPRTPSDARQTCQWMAAFTSGRAGRIL